MSITKDFESKVSPAGFIDRKEIVALEAPPLRELLAHTRALEAMLKKHEWDAERKVGTHYCVECGKLKMVGHSPDCQLAKLLEGVE